MSKQLLFLFIKIMGYTVLAFFSLLGLPNVTPKSAIGQPAPESPPPPPPPPPRGTPESPRTPGSTRPEQACPSLETSLTPINHSQGRDFTVSEYPSFLFYIPYSPENISYLEFFIQDPQTLATVYRTQIQIAQGPGIIQITLPSEPNYALALDKTYRWYLRLDCQANAKDPDLLWTGFVRRVSQNPALENQLSSESSGTYRAYMNHEIWHDAVTSAAELRFQDPDQFKKAWSEVLQSLELENL
ncbi:MAG: DUF928 domain-containing protein, partial [Planktothrix sp.]